MEEIDSEMKELEERQRSLSRVLDSINVQASSVLAFTVQWKELEDYFESARKELRTRLEEQEERVKLVAEVEARAARVKLETEAKEKDLEQKRREIEEGESELVSIKLLIEKKKEELRVNESECLKKLNWVERRVEEKLKEVEVGEKKLGDIRELIDVKREELGECESELEMKEERLRLVETSIGNCDRILELKEKLINVVDLKRKDFVLLEKSMEEWSCKLEECVAKIEGKEEEVDRKIEELSLVHNKFIDEVELKEKHMDSLEESLSKTEKDLVQECCKGSEFTRDGRGLQQLVDEHLKRIDVTGSEMTAILEESSDPAKLVLDAMQGFYPDQGELHFDLRVRRRGCCLLLKELKRISPQISPHVRQEAIELAADWKAKMTVASDNDLEVLGFLRLVFSYDLASIYDATELKSLFSSVSQDKQSADIGQALGIAAPASNRTLQEPAELVLDWMQTEFSDYWIKADICLEATSIKTCIFVLEKLMRDVPHVRPHVEEDAMKLTFQWKAKMRADVENAWEILGFLHFIAAYELVYTLDVDEIVKHLGMIS